MERPFAEEVAGAQQLAVALIPDGDGEVADQAADRGVTPPQERLQDQLRIGRRSGHSQLGPQVVPRVDPAVERGVHTPGRVSDRLHPVERCREGLLVEVDEAGGAGTPWCAPISTYARHRGGHVLQRRLAHR